MIIPLLISCGLGCALFAYIHRIKTGGFERLGKQILEQAQLEAKGRQIEEKNKLDAELHRTRSALRKEEERLKRREEKLAEQLATLEKKEQKSVSLEKALKAAQDEVREGELRVVRLLEERAHLTRAEAREMMRSELEEELQHEANQLQHRRLEEAKQEADRHATKAIATAVGRLANSSASELAVVTVALSSEELKGRIVGREGRNIRLFEQLTGVNVLVDETPGAIALSGYDPLRKEVARQALQLLIADGRIHPVKIEEAISKARSLVAKRIEEAGQQAAAEALVQGLHPELITLLGTLALRVHEGQNVLAHSLEVTHLMAIMAAELGLSESLARRIGLLHDIGKAALPQVEGPHALIGHDLALKWGERREVAEGIGCHHGQMPPTTVEGSLCSAANILSTSRPGARSEPVHHSFRRLKKLEAIGEGFEGVERAFALQAGRELRVTACSEQIDDVGALHLARQIAKQIQDEVDYPGRIKVTVIRETQSSEYAN